MRLFRPLLAILVGLSLTLICQGHDANNRHTGPHVSLLGENNVGHAQYDTSAVANAAHTDLAHYTQEQERPAPAFPNPTFSIPQPDVVVGSTMLDVAHGADSLSMQVVIIFVALCCVLRRYSIASGGRPLLGTGTDSHPDHPPPRYFSLSPAA